MEKTIWGRIIINSSPVLAWDTNPSGDVGLVTEMFIMASA
jgi:hypothetical protein